MSSLKFCFQNEIHKCSKLPTDYKSLVQAVETVFKSQLQGAFDLQYEDCDGDKVMLSNEEDFQAMIESEGAKSIKVFITPKGDTSLFQMRTSQGIASNESQVKKEVVEYQIIDKDLKKSVESPKEIEKIIEVPLVDQQISEAEIKEEKIEIVSKEEEKEIPVIAQPDTQATTYKLFESMLAKALEDKVPEMTKSIEEKLTQSFMNKSLSLEPKVESSSKVVHNMVTCDGCRAYPIVGIRYKCSVCADFDYCETCEATREHAHSFLKIKEKRSCPYSGGMGSMGMAMKGKCQRWRQWANKEELKEEPKVEVPKVEVPVPKVEVPKKEEPKKEEPKKEELKKVSFVLPNPEVFKLYRLDLVKVVKTVPEQICPDSKEVFHTIVIKNTGILDLPQGTYIKSLENEWSQKIIVPALGVKKEYTCILRSSCPKKIGQRQSKFKAVCKNELGEEEIVSEFVLDFEVVEKAVPNEVLTKAKQLQELFPGQDIQYYCESVKTSGNASIEELIENFIYQPKKC